jgi:hypothetical protein
MRHDGDNPGPAWISITLTAAGLVAVFFLLAVLYETHFPVVVEQINVWFGADVIRYTEWMRDDSFRWFLHPLCFALYRSYGKALALFGMTPTGISMAATGFPVILFSSFAMALAAGVFLPPGERTFLRVAGIAAVFLVVGPALLFGPTPESHMPGGAALLAEAAFLYDAIRARARGAPRRQALRRLGLAALFGGLAAGFSITNILPATLLFVPHVAHVGLRPRERQIVKWSVASLVTLAVVGVLVVVMITHAWRLRAILENEGRFLHAPSIRSVAASVDASTTKQFGVPEIGVGMSQDPILPTRALVPREQFAPAPTLAFILWVGAIVLWCRRPETARGARHFALASLAAFLSMALFYAIYASHEAYLFSAHSWPFVVAPGVAALVANVHRPRLLEVMGLAAAVSLGIFQTVVGIASLFDAFRGF